MQRAIILAAGIFAALAIYFVMSLYVIPLSFRDSSEPPRPEAIVSEVKLSPQQVTLGENLTISVTGKTGDELADMQIISIGFPNLTAGSEIEVVKHDFMQTPLVVERGDPVTSAYTASAAVSAQYPSIEASSWPWVQGAVYSIDLRVKPQVEGNFVVFVKAVAFPHTWEGSHYPREGIVDYQQEYVEPHSVVVTKS